MKTRSLHSRLVLGPALLLASCSSSRVAIDFDEQYDFTGKESYAWRAGVPAESELNQKRIEEGIDAALAALGFVKVDGGTSDLLVSTEATYRQEVRSTSGSVGIGVGRTSRHGGVGVGMSSGGEVYEVTVGRLVIEVRDGATSGVVWRAQSERTVTNDPARTTRIIQEVVEDAFADFPPGRGG